MKTLRHFGEVGVSDERKMGRSTLNVTRILLVDGHSLLSDALAHALNELPEMEVVGTATRGEEAIVLASQHRPNVVLLDVPMPGLPPFETAKRIRHELPSVRLAFLSGHITDSYIEEAIQVDAAGYIDKSETLVNVVRAVRQIAAGECYFSPSVRRRLVVPAGATHAATREKTRRSALSPREVEVLRYIAEGLSAKEVAHVLHISERTVNNHRTNLMNKLDIHDRVALTRFALREGLATL